MALSGSMPSPTLLKKASSPSLVPRDNAERSAGSQDPKVEDFQERHNAPALGSGNIKPQDPNANYTMNASTSKYTVMLDASTDDEVTAPLELSKRGIHIPTRTR